MKPQRSRAYAFTLIEILVVIAIVVLLAGLLFPVFSSAREGARTTSCASNLKQIGQAIALYTSDYRQRYPLVQTNPGCTWVDEIYPYAKSPALFQCPSAKRGKYVPGCDQTMEEIPGTFPPLFDGFNGSYDMVTPFIEAKTTNDTKGTVTQYDIEPNSLSVSRYRFPATTILVLDGSDDSYHFHTFYAVVNPGIDPITSVADLKDGGVLPRHKDGVNLLYVDGHVKWHRLQDLTSTPMWRYDGREAVVPTPIPAL